MPETAWSVPELCWTIVAGVFVLYAQATNRGKCIHEEPTATNVLNNVPADTTGMSSTAAHAIRTTISHGAHSPHAINNVQV
jgi:hypothetical protein